MRECILLDLQIMESKLRTLLSRFVQIKQRFVQIIL